MPGVRFAYHAAVSEFWNLTRRSISMLRHNISCIASVSVKQFGNPERRISCAVCTGLVDIEIKVGFRVYPLVPPCNSNNLSVVKIASPLYIFKVS